jgi:hypothetical protein
MKLGLQLLDVVRRHTVTEGYPPRSVLVAPGHFACMLKELRDAGYSTAGERITVDDTPVHAAANLKPGRVILRPRGRKPCAIVTVAP